MDVVLYFQILEFIGKYNWILWLASAVFFIHVSIAFQKIAKKTNTKKSWLAWIPVANFYLYSKIANMHWWPLLLLLGIALGAIYDTIGFLALLVFTIYNFIWFWKIFKKINLPGWWALLPLVPLIGWLMFLMAVGFAAWTKTEFAQPPQKTLEIRTTQQKQAPQKMKPQRISRVEKLKTSLTKSKPTKI